MSKLRTVNAMLALHTDAPIEVVKTILRERLGQRAGAVYVFELRECRLDVGQPPAPHPALVEKHGRVARLKTLNSGKARRG